MIAEERFLTQKCISKIQQAAGSGFRLDTLTTNKQYATPVVTNKEIIATQTDYVNKHPFTFQIIHTISVKLKLQWRCA